jgi:hypothetical protein
VKQGTLKEYPTKTVGEALDSYFEDAEWEAFISNTGFLCVNASGKIFIDGIESEVLVQFHIFDNQTQLLDDKFQFLDNHFLLLDQDKTFEVYAFEIDGEAQASLVLRALLDGMYSDL